MDYSFVCPTCHAAHREPADAAFVLASVCLDCDLEARYHDERSPLAIVVKAAA